MPTRAERRDILGQSVVVEEIDNQVDRFHLHGAYLRSRDLKLEKKGDGYLIVALNNGSHLLLVADISLGKYDRATPSIAKQGQSINEARMLEELLATAKTVASADNVNPAGFIQRLSETYYPDYLKDPAIRVKWGYSITAAFLDPASPNIKVAAMGTNFYGIGQGDNHFLVAQPPDGNFFSPYKRGLDIFDIRTAEINRNTHRLLVSTDGITLTKRPPFGWGGQEVNLNREPQGLLGNNREGLYLVISPSLSSN